MKTSKDNPGKTSAKRAMKKRNTETRKSPLSLVLALGALGVVFGDLGTSPLYTLRQSFDKTYQLAVNVDNILGILSLIFWSLIIVVSIKYLVFVLRADNEGEGGILALTALVTSVGAQRGNGRWYLLILGLFGAALLYGDGMITPAISVLSAVEGLNVATSTFEPYIVPIAIAVLVLLFITQRRGTGSMGRVFGPVMLLWFVVLAALGLGQIVQEPRVLAALNPLEGLNFFLRNGVKGFFVLGSVVLALTGAEALYADIGHFGKAPIRLDWFTVALPALLLNYFGQGAFAIAHPAALVNPFFQIVPSWAIYPVVVLATLATVIASQALISGVFSLTSQAVQLGYAPRLRINHTSSEFYGQIYVPTVNWALMLACIALVLGFRSSNNLGTAYGVAITGTMVITSLLFFFVATQRWKWSPALTGLLMAIFLAIDLSFFSANIIKVLEGGWVPLVVAALVFLLMRTWQRGRRLLAHKVLANHYPAKAFVKNLTKEPPTRVPGTAVFMHSRKGNVPPALLTNLKWNKVLHETVVFLSVEVEERPRIPVSKRIEAKLLGEGIHQVVLHYGFMEKVFVLGALHNLELDGVDFNPDRAIFFIGRETPLAADHSGMAAWRVALFAAMARNARPATASFGIPPERVIELGTQIEL